MVSSGLVAKKIIREKRGWFSRHERPISRVAKYAVLIILLIFCLLPFIWIWLAALKGPRELFGNIFGLPHTLHWENFARAWAIGHFGNYVGNSFVITIPSVIGVCGLSTLAGYAFAKLDFIGRDLVFYLFLAGLMIPFQAIMIPLYYQLLSLHLLGTYWAAILPMIGSGLPFGIFLMRAFFRGLPNELIDSARVDGCSQFAIFWRIMVPLAVPAIASLTVFQFMFSWNNFLIPLIYVQTEELRPLTVGLMFFQGRYLRDYGLTAAGVTIATLPIIVVYLIFQRQFIRGLTAGAIKG